MPPNQTTTLLRRFPTSVKSGIMDVRRIIDSGRFAIYAGAGLDCALAFDWKPELSTKCWGDMVLELGAFPKETLPNKVARDGATHLACQWPMEITTVARARLGDNCVRTRLAELLNPPQEFDPKQSGQFTKAFGELAKRSGLLITTNYSEWIAKTLKGLDLSKHLRILHREDLPSFSFDQLRRWDEEEIYLIHVHGRATFPTLPILDAWGYSIARDEDIHYFRFLQNLFSYRTVISLGSSWVDFPLRSAAAQSQRTRRYSRRRHLFIRRRKDVDEAALKCSCQPVSQERVYAVAMRASYGVEVVDVLDKEQGALLSAIMEPPVVLEPPKIAAVEKVIDRTYLLDVAQFLDDHGDYESPEQESWISGGESTSPRVNARENVELLVKGLDELLTNMPWDWPIAARIERHLRHQLWLYGERSKRKDYRKKLWENIVNAALGNQTQLDGCDPRLIFDLWIGLHEISEGKHEHADKLKSGFAMEPYLMARAKLAYEVWVKKNANPEMLLDLGWESVSAKAVLDGIETLIKNNGCQDEIVVRAEQAAALARLAGAFRREVKADVLAAVWARNPQEGRTRILSRLRAFEGRNIGQFLLDGLAVGLAVCSSTTPNIKLQRRSLEEHLAEVGIVLDEVDNENVNNYWLNLVAPTSHQNISEAFDIGAA